MADKTYNGWTNYATWRVNLEVFDGIDPREFFESAVGVYDLSKQLESFVEEVVLGDSTGLAADYAASFLANVDYYQIAEHMAADYDLFEEEEEEV